MTALTELAISILNNADKIGLAAVLAVFLALMFLGILVPGPTMKREIERADKAFDLNTALTAALEATNKAQTMALEANTNAVKDSMSAVKEGNSKLIGKLDTLLDRGSGRG